VSRPVINPEACAVLERTADFKAVGRCWFRVDDGRCPRHGDVAKVQEHYRKTGRLTDELDLPKRRSPNEKTTAGGS
jgi:hypothetical protein